MDYALYEFTFRPSHSSILSPNRNFIKEKCTEFLYLKNAILHEAWNMDKMLSLSIKVFIEIVLASM